MSNGFMVVNKHSVTTVVFFFLIVRFVDPSHNEVDVSKTEVREKGERKFTGVANWRKKWLS